MTPRDEHVVTDVAVDRCGNAGGKKDLPHRPDAVEEWLHVGVAAGIEPEDRVGIMLPNTAAFTVVYFGILGSGGGVSLAWAGGQLMPPWAPPFTGITWPVT
jgi:non-ribosomal peptide synthetase component E (peptide arylation enzyme)